MFQEYKFFDGLVLSEKGNKKVWNNVVSSSYPALLPLEKSYGKQTESQAAGKKYTTSFFQSFFQREKLGLFRKQRLTLFIETAVQFIDVIPSRTPTRTI